MHKLTINDVRRDPKLKDQFVEENTGLVYHVLHSRFGWLKGTLLWEDYFHEGIIALLKAMDTFDLNRECTFATYAVPTISGSLLRLVRETRSIIKISRPLLDIYAAYLTWDTSMYTDRQIAENIKVPYEKLLDAKRAHAAITSLSQEFTDTDGSTLIIEDTLAEDSFEAPYIETCHIKDKLNLMLECYPKGYDVMMHRLKGMTQRDVAKLTGLSQTSIFRRLGKARYLYQGPIEDYLAGKISKEQLVKLSKVSQRECQGRW